MGFNSKYKNFELGWEFIDKFINGSTALIIE
jgi:hypothetical protein